MNIELVHRVRECICLEWSLADNLETTTCGIDNTPPAEVAVRATLLWARVVWPELVCHILLVNANKCARCTVDICLVRT